eukprot:8084868-Alexandrium_andersonii.AAC.1
MARPPRPCRSRAGPRDPQEVLAEEEPHGLARSNADMEEPAVARRVDSNLPLFLKRKASGSGVKLTKRATPHSRPQST